MWKYFGTIVNALVVVLGGGIGVLLKKRRGSADGENKLTNAIMVCLGLCTMFAAVSGLNGVESGVQAIVVVVSMVLGVLIGTLLKIDDAINHLGDRIVHGDGKTENPATGMVMASLVFCIGSMTILGSFEGAMNPAGHLDIACHTTILIKSLLDFCMATCFAVTYGASVMLSAVPVLVFQGLLVLLVSVIKPYLLAINALPMEYAVGSLILIAIALNISGIKKIKTADYLPALALPIIICSVLRALGIEI